MGDGEPRALRGSRVRAVCLTVLSLVVLWWLVGVVFSSDRGLDLHDEGLYLLAADHGNLLGTWTTPFGWHTRPFFLLLGGSIVRLRTFAVVALVLVGAGLGAAIGRVTVAGRDRHDRATRALLVTIGGLGGPMLAASLLRTPGYNWVNLVGLAGAAAGVVLALRLRPDASQWRSPATIGAAGTIAAGAWFATPGKPTSAIAVAAVGAAVLWTRTGRRRVGVLAVLATAIGVALVVLSVVARWWPTSFLGVLRTGSRVPPLHENQTITGALRDVLRTPKVALQDLRHLRVASLLLVTLGAAGAWMAPGPRTHAALRPAARQALRLAPIALCSLAAVGTAAPLPVLGGASPAYRFAWFGTTNAAVLLLLGASLHVWAHRDRLDRARLGLAVRIAAMLLALTVAFGLGSAMSIYHQAALAALLLWCAAGALVAAVGTGSSRSIAVGLVATAALLMLATNVVDSRAHPFLFGDIGTNTVPLEIGTRGETLLLEGPVAEHLGGLQRAATASGFCAGTPLLGFQWQWSATEQFALGAEVPDMLLLTIFGYPDPFTALGHSLGTLDREHWSGAWIITTDPAMLDPDEAAEIRAALDRLPTAIGRTFPADYALAASADGTQLWRPAGVAPRACG